MDLIRLLLKQSRALVAFSALMGLCHGAAHVGLLYLMSLWVVGHGQVEPRLGLWFLALLLFVPVSKVTSEVAVARLAQQAIFDLRMELSRRLLAAPLSQLDQVGGRLLKSSLTDDLQYVVGSLIQFPIMWHNFAILLASLVFLFAMSWSMTVAIVVFVVVGIWTWKKVLARAARYVELAESEEKALFGHFSSLVEGVKELKLDPALKERFLAEWLAVSGDRQRQYKLGEFLVWSAGGAWTFFLIYGIFGATLFLLPAPLGYDYRAAAVFLLVFLFCLTPLDGLMNQFIKVGPATRAYRRVVELSRSLAAEPAGVPDRLPGIPALVELAGARVEAGEGEEGRRALGPVDLALQPGELLVIAGGLGSGKTALAKLLTGLYAPAAGEIRVDGRAVAAADLEGYRALCAGVFPDSEVFAGLRPAAPEALREELAGLARKLQIAGALGEDGRLTAEELTPPQRRRLALLEAFALDRFLYVFDEWAFEQDLEFREVFYREYLPALRERGKIVVVLTSEERYLDAADRLLWLTEGRLEEPRPKVVSA